MKISLRTKLTTFYLNTGCKRRTVLPDKYKHNTAGNNWILNIKTTSYNNVIKNLMLDRPCALNPLEHSGYCVSHIHNNVTYLLKARTVEHANGSEKKHSFLDNGLEINMSPKQRINTQQQRYCWKRCFLRWSVPRSYKQDEMKT
jgi:hypothetical protein